MLKTLPFSVTCMNNPETSHRNHYWKAALVTPLLLVGAGYIYFSHDNSMPDRQPANTTDSAREENKNFATQPSWQQDFSKLQAIDPLIWNKATPSLPIYNDEEQLYTDRPSNIRIENGSLVLEAHKEEYKNASFTSGRIDTHNLQSFTYGKIEATMKFPVGAGTWPAFWMLSASNKYTERRLPNAKDWEDPRFYMHDGELDIVEHVGAKPGRVESSAHTYAASKSQGTKLDTAETKFHTYGILWTPKKLSFTVDGRMYHQVTKESESSEKWPFDQPAYLILNLAMGGKMGGEIDITNYDSWKLLVKRVAYYSYVGNAAVP